MPTEPQADWKPPQTPQLADLASDERSNRVLASVDMLIAIALAETSTWAQGKQTRTRPKPDVRSAVRALELGARVLGVLGAGQKWEPEQGLSEAEVVERARKELAKSDPEMLRAAGIKLAGLRVVGGGRRG